MKDTLSPCLLTKEALSKQLKGWLEDDEYISDWEITPDDELRVFIEKQ